MAYNSYFPTGYYQPQPQQMYYPTQSNGYPMQQNVGATQSNAIIWVNNETEAQNYPVAPNNAVALWDSNRAAIYLKQADASGRPSFKAFDLVEHKNADLSNENTAVNNFISKADLDGLKQEIEALRAILTKKIGEGEHNE